MSLLVGYSDSEAEEDMEQEEGEEESPQHVVLSILEDLVTRATIKREKEEEDKDAAMRHRHRSSVDSDEYDSSSGEEESSSSSEEDSSEEDEDDKAKVVQVKEEEENEEDKTPSRRKGPAPSALAEDGMKLPPIEDLFITVPEAECHRIGTVERLVGDLVIVKADPGTPALDLDSVLFLDKGRRALGRVFDVLGRVSEPRYCIRFNSREHASESGAESGKEVFCAPRTEHSSFVFVEQLRRMKGSDASWKGDEEPPPKFLDFSDDEEERDARRARKSKAKEGSGDQDFVLPNEGHSRKRNSRGGSSATVSADQNPFYRRQRHYNPRDYGPIRWNSVHTPTAAAYRAADYATNGPSQYRVPPPNQHQGFIRAPVFQHSFHYPPPTGGPLPNPFGAPPPQHQHRHQNMPLFCNPPPPPPHK